MIGKRRSTDTMPPARPVADALAGDRLTTKETAAWGDLLEHLLSEAHADQRAAEIERPPKLPRRPPALTPARRAALTHEVIIARHRWTAAFGALLDARHTFEANVSPDGRSIITRCSPVAAATLHPHATEEQP